jgi:hypothetical protein
MQALNRPAFAGGCRLEKKNVFCNRIRSGTNAHRSSQDNASFQTAVDGCGDRAGRHGARIRSRTGGQLGVESTGLLGPTVESLIAEQQSNFGDVNARLDTLVFSWLSSGCC